MKWFLLILVSILSYATVAQNLGGKWFGKVSQGPGGYSNLYNLEFNLSQKKNIWGDSYSWEEPNVKIRIGLFGRIDRDSIRFYESNDWIKEDIVPWGWVACIKKFSLVYYKENSYEYLEGSWNGLSKDDPKEACIPGKVILSRSLEGLNKFLEQNKDSLINTSQQISLAEPDPIDFSKNFLETKAKKVTEIIVYHPDLQIQLMDYMKSDNDTVSIYLNRAPLAKNIRISKRPILINFQIDKRIENHELLLYAENLGLIPPNTSELILVDGERKHRIMIVSDKEKTATIYLRYNPNGNE